MTPQERADELVETFSLFDDWEDRYGLLIDMGRKLPPLDESEKTEENRVLGCQSRVWVVAHARPADPEPVIEFVAESDASIVKGLIAILHRVYSGQPAALILDYDVQELLVRLDLEQHLSMTRRNGLHGMIQRIKALAVAEARGKE